MSKDHNKVIVQQLVTQVWNKADAGRVGEFYADDFVFHTEGGDVQRGPDSIRQWLQVTHTAFPDISYQIGAIYAEGDKVAFRYTVAGNNTGDFRGIPATGKTVHLTGHMILHLNKDGKVVEGHGYWDTLGLMQQIGLVPEFGPPRA
jgi:steroid delta-isomerase-like uncharacterized protein